MYKHLLVPTDGSELSLTAVKEAAKFARRLGASITVLHVRHEPPGPVVGEGLVESRSEAFYEEYVEQSSTILSDAAAEIERANLHCQRRTAVSNRPWEAIIKTATEEGCDLIFMASHGRSGLAGLLIGSETHKVLTHCHIPVLVCR